MCYLHNKVKSPDFLRQVSMDSVYVLGNLLLVFGANGTRFIYSLVLHYFPCFYSKRCTLSGKYLVLIIPLQSHFE